MNQSITPQAPGSSQTRGWEALQQPIHSASLPAGHLRLLAALDQGWVVVEPVLFHPAAYPGLGGTYEFNLAAPENAAVETVMVQASAALGALLRREHLNVRNARA